MDNLKAVRVGMDLDGVCYDFGDALREYILDLGNPHGYVMDEPQRWEFYLDWGMSTSQFLRTCAEGVDAGRIFREGDTTEDAEVQLHRLMRANCTVHIVTDRTFGTRAKGNTFEWLEMQGIPYHTITFTGDKASVPLDFMIDDKIENYDALDAAGVSAFLLDRPWNRGSLEQGELHLPSGTMYFVGEDGRRRVKTLAQFVDLVVAHAEKVSPSGVMESVDADVRRLAESTLTPRHYIPDADRAMVTSGSGEVRTTSSTGGEKGVKPARFDLIPAGPMWEVAEHYGRGAEKYEDRNWERGYEWSKSFGAMMRHAWAFWRGEDCDPETGSHHMAAVVFHALALIEFGRTQRAFDDRATYEPEPGAKELLY